MSDVNNQPISFTSNTSNVTGLESANPSASPHATFSTGPDPPISSINTHTVAERVRNAHGESLVTTLAGAESDNPNGQAEHGNGSTPGTTRGSALQHRRRPIPLTILTSLEGATTDGQALGLDDLATGNDMQAPSTPTRGFHDPTSFGVPRTNHHWTAPPCRRDADNFLNFGISSAADFSHSGEPVSELSHPMERSTSSGTTAALPSHPPAGGNDDGVPSGSIVLRDFSRDLEEWRSTPDNEEQGNRSQHGNTNEISSLNVGDLRLGTPAQERLAMLAPFSQYPENETSGAAPGEHTTASNRANSTNPVRGHGLAAVVENEHADHGDGRAMARPNTPIQPQTSDTLTPFDLTSHHPEKRASNADPTNGSYPNGQTNSALNIPNPIENRSPATSVVSADIIDHNQGVERNPSNSNISNIDRVQENALEGRGYSIGAGLHIDTASPGEAFDVNNIRNRNRNRRAPRPVGSLIRMSREEVGKF